MGKRVTVQEASNITGLTDYALRSGIKQGRYPHIRTGLGRGKILIDIDLLEQYLQQEAVNNVSSQRDNIDNPAVINYGQLRRVNA